MHVCVVLITLVPLVRVFQIGSPVEVIYVWIENESLYGGLSYCLNPG